MEPIEILLVGGASTAFGGAAVLATLSGAIREPAKRVIIATLKLQDEWDKLTEEAKLQYQAETGEPKEKANKETIEIGEEGKGAGEIAGSTVSPI